MAYVWAEYISDDGRTWLVRITTFNASDPSRGFTAVESPITPQLPRGWLTRKVFGLVADGRRRTAAVSSTDADLWTGVAATFNVLGNDGVPIGVTVTGRLEERALVVPG